MDQRDAGTGPDTETKREGLSKEELDVMPLEEVVSQYEKLAKEVKTRTRISETFIVKREAKSLEQRGNVNLCRAKLMADKMAEAEVLKAYIVTRMMTPV